MRAALLDVLVDAHDLVDAASIGRMTAR